MAYDIDGDYATFTAGEAITQHALVMIKTSSTTSPVEVIETTGVADADRTVVGVADEGAAQGSPVTVRLLNRGGIIKCLADGIGSVGDMVFPADDGQVTNAATADTGIGIQIEASTAANDVISVVPCAQLWNTGS